MAFEPTPSMPTLRGRPVIDLHLAPVGHVTDVLFEDGNPTPNWAIVKTSMLSGEHFVPLPDAYVDDEGRLVVPFDKATVKHAPKAHRDHVLTPDVEDELREYYSSAA